MKIKDIIIESELRKTFKSAATDVQTWPELDNGNVPYLQYRFGLAMAVSPNQHMEKVGPVGGQLTTVGYTNADREIIDGAAKILGVKSVKRTSKGSEEIDTINSRSPVSPRGPVVKKR